MIFSFCHWCQQHAPVVHLELKIFHEFISKIWNGPNGIPRGLGGKLIHEKTWSRKSRDSVPLKLQSQWFRPCSRRPVCLVPGGKLAAGELQRELQRVGEEVAEVLERAGVAAPSKALAQPLSTVHHSSLGFPAHGILFWGGILGPRLLLHAFHSHLQQRILYSPPMVFFDLRFINHS